MSADKSARPATAHRGKPGLPAPAEGPVSILVIAAWFALLTGLGEAAIQAASKFLLNRIVRLGLDVIWMTPLSDLFFFAVPAIVLILLARRRPRLASLGVVVFPFAFLGFASLLLMVPRLQPYAAWLLAAGLAVQSARLAAAHPRGFYALVRYSVGWMGLFGRLLQRIPWPRPKADEGATDAASELSRREFLLSAGATFAGLAAGVSGWQALVERRALALLPLAPAAGAPNVLLVVLDTVRAQSLSVHGYARPTSPQLERLARRGVYFERAVSTAPWTLPSHASMFTGRYPHELSVGWRRPLDGAYPTLAEVLSARGYVTAGFIANTVFCSRDSGLARGFVHYEDVLAAAGQIARSSSLGDRIIENYQLRRLTHYYGIPGRKTAEAVSRDFLRWLTRGGSEGRPFFAFLNYYDAHYPYLASQPFDEMFAPQARRIHPPPYADRPWTPEEVQAETDAYDGSIAYIDHQVGLLFDELESRSWLENTLVIITSDHGEEFYEHGLLRHGNSLYVPSLRVPLLISFPSRVPAGERLRRPATLRDLPATVTDLLGLEGPVRFPGASLAQHWGVRQSPEGPAAAPVLAEVDYASGVPVRFPVSRGDMKSLVADPYHYILNGDGREELYDWQNDPWEQQDLSGSEAGRVPLEQFRASLPTILQQAGQLPGSRL